MHGGEETVMADIGGMIRRRGVRETRRIESGRRSTATLTPGFKRRLISQGIFVIARPANDAFNNRNIRPPLGSAALTATAGIQRGHLWASRMAILTTFALITMPGWAQGANVETDYLKPLVSSKDCVNTAKQIASKTESLGNDGACMQCDPANNVCPPGCQALVDDLYVNCDGVTTPDGLFYDPDNVIEGTWSPKVKATIKIATERCGCNSAVGLTGGLQGEQIFSTARRRVWAVTAGVGFSALLSLMEWWLGSYVL